MQQNALECLQEYYLLLFGKDFFLKDWAIKNYALILSAFSANIEVRLFIKLREMISQLGDFLSEMSLIEVLGVNLKNLSVYSVLNHFIQQLSLIPLPKIPQAYKSKSLTDILYSESQVIAGNSSHSYCLHIWVLSLDL